jgi:hypothetical protein
MFWFITFSSSESIIAQSHPRWYAEKTFAKRIWPSTTPVPEGGAGRFLGDEIWYIAVAAKIMHENDIPINDL